MVKDETANKHGRLTVIERVGTDNNRNATWLCLCQCGNKTVVAGDSLRTGNTRSCGCLMRDTNREKLSGANNPHWNNGVTYSHGYKIICLNGTRVPEQRMIVGEVMGRQLIKGEVVHHINGNKLDNRNSNLLLCTQKYHMDLHQTMAHRYQQEHFGGL